MDNIFSKDTLNSLKIDNSTLDLTLSIVFLLCLYRKNLNVQDYKIFIDTKNNKIHIENTKNNSDGFIELGRRSIIQAKHIFTIISMKISSNEINIKEVKQLVKNKNCEGLCELFKIELITEKKPIIQIDNEIFDEELDIQFEKEEKINWFKNFSFCEDAKYCYACDQRPCMCSDPDPG